MTPPIDYNALFPSSPGSIVLITRWRVAYPFSSKQFFLHSCHAFILTQIVVILAEYKLYVLLENPGMSRYMYGCVTDTMEMPCFLSSDEMKIALSPVRLNRSRL